MESAPFGIGGIGQMSITTALIGAGGRIVATISRKAWEWGLARSAPLLSVKMEEMEAKGMLRAFNVTLRNASAQSVRLRELFIGRPDGARFAIRWRPLAWFADEGPGMSRGTFNRAMISPRRSTRVKSTTARSAFQRVLPYRSRGQRRSRSH
jgi:hypothetical protein